MVRWNDYKLWLGENLAGKLPEYLNCPNPNLFSTDSRQAIKEKWFIPLKGENFDGHHFIESALTSGAEGALCCLDFKSKISKQFHNRLIYVQNSNDALAMIAKGHRSLCKNLKVIALTGSTGKTTAKEILAHILSPFGNTYRTYKNFNNEVGVAKSLLDLNINHKFAVLELAARKKNDIKYLTNMAVADVSICLNVGTAHLGNYNNVNELLFEKTNIYRHSPSKSIHIVPADDTRILKIAKSLKNNIITFGYSKNSHITITAVSYYNDGTMGIKLKVFDNPMDIHLPIAHVCYPINVAAAVAACSALEIDLSLLEKPFAKFSGLEGRYKVIKKRGLTIIDDTYNASPESMRAGLETLTLCFPENNKTIILGDMLELGESAQKEHEEIGKFCANKVNPATIITVGELSQHIAEAAQLEGHNKVLHYKTVEDLLEKEIDLNDQVIYAKGSRNIQLQKIIKKIISQ